jgi:gamma-glutamyltranspeptidase/glutathione hydrolase
VQEHGGAITRRDLETYRVIRRRPVEVAYRGDVFESNPPPSSGGVLIGYGLALLDRAGPPSAAGSASDLRRVLEALREQARVRDERFTRELYRGGLARRLLSESSLSAAARRLRDAPQPEVASPGGTTHISTMDAEGNAASLSSSTGAGSGVVVPGTGIHMNNMLGEYDLQPGGRVPRPGTRLTSMMSPSVVVSDGEPRLVLGSAGSTTA